MIRPVEINSIKRGRKSQQQRAREIEHEHLRRGNWRRTESEYLNIRKDLPEQVELEIGMKIRPFPVIYERIHRDTDGGLSLMLQANGLNVLALLPGLIEKLPGKALRERVIYSTVCDDVSLIASYDTGIEGSILDADPRKGLGMGIRRHDFLHMLSQSALEAGIEIHWDRMVTDVEQNEDLVTVKLIDGTTDSASFLVGCDGLHSNTRVSLFGKEEETYTGISQMGGFSPRPNFVKTSKMIDFFGEEAHMITYQVSETMCSWAIARTDKETRETWRAVDETKLEELKQDPVADWPFGAGELLKGADKIIKYGLYDRPALQTWYKGRVVLLGDAAHPTTPHLGQGGNQALEDVYHLVRVLKKYNPDAGSPSTQVLEQAWAEYEGIRLPRTAALVKEARAMGEKRVTVGRDACLKRNEELRETWKDTTKEIHRIAVRVSGPYQGEPEI